MMAEDQDIPALRFLYGILQALNDFLPAQVAAIGIGCLRNIIGMQPPLGIDENQPEPG